MSRFLFATTPGVGHTAPAYPVARTLVARGFALPALGHVRDLRAMLDRESADVIVGGADPAELMPHVDVFLTNGGYGGTQLVLSHGVPIVGAGRNIT
ncbi:glycosyltransferase family 1 protein [Candidatus Frankia alpina]|uniref:Glycosyltransferase family 1 protein n=1 Tax=Candidatus Frankia alpina TaxID=2699483 RepID=A0A4S5ESL8_9ACTN|nr:glycosyltransferase family 1 protein [Candidatus Frankia alpina]THJ75414.1 glycosyltransferase family 1 protein [Candidatus Frankia alpina]